MKLVAYGKVFFLESVRSLLNNPCKGVLSEEVRAKSGNHRGRRIIVARVDAIRHLISSHLIITRHGTFRHAGRKDTGNCTTKP